MKRRLLCACLALVFYFPQQAPAQFTDPRTYTNSPIGLNQLELGYAYVHANSSIDASIVITSANVNLSQGTIDYTRYLGLLHRLMWVEAAVPVAGLSESVSGTAIQGSTAGTGDSSYSVAMLLKGGRALSVSQFESYQPATTLGVSFTMTAPTGSYDPNKILNLGSDRWSFKPEVGLSCPFGLKQKWGSSMRMAMFISTQTTVPTAEGRSCGKSRCLEQKHTSVTGSITDFPPRWIPVTRFAARRRWTKSTRTIHKEISLSEAN